MALPRWIARRSLLQQATTRLVASLALAMTIIVMIVGWVYLTTQERAARAESEELRLSYQRKLVELENDWETRALRFKSGIEYTRILEDRGERWNKLYGYLTAQGEQAAFSQLAITGADDRVIFRFGPGAQSLPQRIVHAAIAAWYFQPESEALFRVYFQPIWLGEEEGMGHMVLFLPLDNALLYRNAAPQTDLFLFWGGQRVASSLGASGASPSHLVPTGVMQTRQPWPGSGDQAPELVIRHAATAPVSVGELVAGSLLALASLLGVLWMVQGLWMLRLTQRVAALGKASEEFAHGYAVSAQLKQHLDSAVGKHQDEISLVARSLESLTVAVMEREAERNAREKELRESETQIRESEQALRDSRDQLEERVRERTADLEAANVALFAEKGRQEELIRKLEEAHNQLLQSEKMASIGQLAAGVAHEINNPVGFVNSNVGTLERYLNNLFKILDAYEQAEAVAGSHGKECDQVRSLKDELDYAYLKEDVFGLIHETRDGLARVKKIVQDLKDFSHVDEVEWQWADLHMGLDSTLNVVNNEIKYKAAVVKEYGDLPPVECLPFQLNQVFMNLLVNAAHAIVERGIITLRTGRAGDEVWVEIADTGNGIAPENLKRIFDPFFTTKPVGKGTGLGLSLSYGIVQKHHGRIEVQSEPGKGTTFRVTLPVQQPKTDQESVL